MFGFDSLSNILELERRSSGPIHRPPPHVVDKPSANSTAELVKDRASGKHADTRAAPRDDMALAQNDVFKYFAAKNSIISVRTQENVVFFHLLDFVSPNLRKVKTVQTTTHKCPIAVRALIDCLQEF